ncbi:MAG: crotonase/enoyl-CoA hydratase family protein [Hyphomicrobiales bacterium]|nr:crotonase/enoyl-CoA hydratase family protein [Hyphomicrobiales bacterium]
MSETPTVTVERDGAVAVLRLNRPDKKNAFTAEMYAAVTSAWREAEADDAVAAHLWLGLPGAFSAGNDIEDFVRMTRTGSLGVEILDFLRMLASLEKPLVIGVDGLAIGVGTTALLHADLVVASETSLFRTPFTDLGLVPEAASSLLGPRRLGHAVAFELLVAGVPFDAARAAAVGLVNRVVAPEALEGAARETARALAAKPRAALAASRRLLRDVPGCGRAEILARIEEEAREFAARLASPEAAAAFAAFAARKK